ncbi:MAG: hypothetical protein K6F53_04675 [Lachnospiraceae bacterium]|nr:hypothetical protein [Lachnospiraceae bacterium]
MNEKKIRNCILISFAACLTAFVLCAAVIAYVDPFFHYHGPLENFPYIVDNQLTQNPGMAEHMDYDSVILGSSMTVNFETDDFRDLMGLKTLKLSYSSAYPKDISNIMEKIFASRKDGQERRIKKVFLGLDIVTYSGDVEETKYPLPEYLYDRNPFNDVSYLLNKDVLLDYVLRPVADPEPTNLSHVYASWWTDEYYSEEWVLKGHEMPAANETKMDPEEFVLPIEKNLDVNIIPFIEAHPETEFVIFFPPYSILFWDNVLTENHLEATIRAYETAERKLNGYENVTMYFFPAEEKIVTDLNNYADYTHYHPRYNRYMAECFSDGTDVIGKSGSGRAPDDGTDMKGYIEKLRGMIAEYDFDTLNEKLREYHGG